MRKHARVIHFILAAVLLLAPAATPVAWAGAAAGTEALNAKVSVEYKDAPLSSVLQSLADAAGSNLLLDHSVSGHVTLTLRDHAIIDAIGLIARLNGYEYQLVGNTIIVAAPERFEQLLSADHTLYTLKHAPAQQAAAMVSRIFPKLTVMVDAADERLILTGFPADVAGAMAFLENYDQAGTRPQSFVRAPVEDVIMAIAGKAGWNVVLQGIPDTPITAAIESMEPEEAMRLVAEAAGLEYRLEGKALFVRTQPAAETVTVARETRIHRLDYADPELASDMLRGIWPSLSLSVDKAARAVVMHGSPAELDQGVALLKQYDFAPGQVYVEARVEEISLEAMRRLGLEWDVPDFEWGGSQLASATLSWNPADLRTKLELLNETGDSTILASPRLAALDGEEARILIGDRIPLLINEVTPDGNVIERLEYIEAGISLEITPKVGQDGYITLDIVTEVSSITGSTSQGVPQMRTREATTRIRVKDGQPLVIGGLIQEEELITTRGLPWVKDLPLVGSLFRNTVAERVQSETVIFLIPRIVRDSDAPAQTPTSLITGGPVPINETRSAPIAAKAKAAPKGLERSFRLNLNHAFVRAVTAEVEGSSGNYHLFSRLYGAPQGSDLNWGLGLGVRRYVLTGNPAPWVDVTVNRIQPRNAGAALLLSARVGAQANLTDRLYVEPYLDYTVLPWESDPNWSVRGYEAGLAGGFQLGWRY